MQNLEKPSPQFNEKILSALQRQGADVTRLDISKDWHVIYYLLTGSSEIAEHHRIGDPLHNVIFGGLNTSVCTGYGPVRYFDHSLVGEIRTALSDLDRSLVELRFDPAKFVKHAIYAAPDEDEKDMILEEIERLCCFFGEAATAEEYVVVYGH
jgi:hypothetical protein